MRVFGFGFGVAMAAMLAAGGTPAPSPVYDALSDATPFSTFLGVRNGDQYQRAIQGPTLSNLFGNGNNAGTAGGQIPGAIAIRVRFQPGGIIVNSASASNTQGIPILGSGGTTASRSCTLYWVPAGASQAGFAGRFIWYNRDRGGVYSGDRDPTTGAAGSSASTRGLRSAIVTPDDTGVICGTVILSLDGAGQFQVRFVRNDGTLQAGDTFTPAGFMGNATPANSMVFGSYFGATAAYGQYFPGTLADFLQLDGSGGTDAEWQDFARGGDPATIWGASLAAHYRLGGPTDLAKTAGSRAYAAATLIGTGHIRGTELRPVRSGANGIHAWPLWRRYTHALPPAAVRSATSAADLINKTGDVVRQVLIVGAATHVEARAVRESDDRVMVDWTQISAAPFTGLQTLTLPNVPTGTYRWLFRRADDRTVISISRDYERIGPVMAIIGQSQAQIAFFDATSVTLDPPTSGLVSFCAMRGAGARYTPIDGGAIGTRNVVSDGMVAFAQLWEVIGAGVPIELVGLFQNGSATHNFMYRDVSNGFDLWGDSVTPTSGMVTGTMAAKRNRITGFLLDWSTSDTSTAAAGGTALTFATAYGSRTPVERPWVERVAELFAGVPKSTADSTERAERQNFQKLGLVNRPWVVTIPVGRHRDISANPAGSGSGYETFRKIQHDWALSGVGLDAGIDATLGAYRLDFLLGPSDSAHQDRTDPRGNIRFCQRWAHALARACHIEAYDPTPAFASATRSGAVITLPATMKNGGALMTGVNGATPAEFEVSEDGGSSWSKMGGAIAFTPALSGNSITLTRSSGNWAPNTRIRYLANWPAAVGNGQIAAETILTNGMLYESYANAEMPLAGAVQGIPLLPAFAATPLVAT
ncbi:hypothetical protein ACFOKF_16645 [Sphingobium rhizovicinum]|uniref:Uncharacterized protein n=1 Tax=Sphingobium rhizovicinum TaxID=432308 RepID=A0ABV7NH45_9SPHN